MVADAVVDGRRALALTRTACPEREVMGNEEKVFHRKAKSTAQKALTGKNEEGTIRSKVTKIVINGVWEWVSPRFAVWLVAC
jgi:hypothetical protein